MVDVAPYGGVFPLTAIINKANHNVQDVKVTVLGKGEKGIPISYDVGPQAINTHDGIPVFGLYPDYVNKVKVDWTEEGKKTNIYVVHLRRTGIITLYYRANCRSSYSRTG